MKPYRKEKVASAIRHIVGEAIAHELHDPRVDMLTTVTRVEVSGDLLFATVFLTVTGGDATQRKTLQGVRSAGGFLQRRVARELQIRHCPALRFEIDRQELGARRTHALLAENLRLDPSLAEPPDDHVADSTGFQSGTGAAPDRGPQETPQDLDT